MPVGYPVTTGCLTRPPAVRAGLVPAPRCRADRRRPLGRPASTSSNPVVLAELPGALHGFDLFRSRRFDTVVDGIEAFTATVRSHPSGAP
jgi:hypothetical protein